MAKKHKKRNRDGKKTKRVKWSAATADRHILYEESVQCVEADLDFFRRVFRRKRGYPCRSLREDFCGTAALACEWIRRDPANTAIGVDLDRPTLDWGIEHHVARLGDAAKRLTLLQEDVLTVETTPVQAAAALNFSYQVFKDRETLRRYFRAVHHGLASDGIFFLDAFGGTEAMEAMDEDRRIVPETRPDGTRYAPFTYVWDQAEFNPIDHHMLCHIHFKFADGTEIKRAFTYDWRLWTLPELQELMREAGFSEVEVYMEGWDDEEDEADGIFRRRTKIENMVGWVAYVVGLK